MQGIQPSYLNPDFVPSFELFFKSQEMNTEFTEIKKKYTTKMRIKPPVAFATVAFAALAAFVYKQFQHTYGTLALGIVTVLIGTQAISTKKVPTKEFGALLNKVNMINNGLKELACIKKRELGMLFDESQEKELEAANRFLKDLSHNYNEQAEFNAKNPEARGIYQRILTATPSSFGKHIDHLINKQTGLDPAYKTCCTQLAPAVHRFLTGNEQGDWTKPYIAITLIAESGIYQADESINTEFKKRFPS
jgi:hypothetical protein